MKIDRLIAITMYLLNREIVSASALAERFEVSKRTIQRDIEALNQAGIPIASTYGAETSSMPINSVFLNLKHRIYGILSTIDQKPSYLKSGLK